MSSNSARLHAPVDMHQHEDPPEPDTSGSVIPDGRPEVARDSGDCPLAGRLWRENGRVLFQGGDDAEPSPARVVWARPLSERGGAASVMLAGKKRELAYLPSLDVLDADSRRVAEEELAAGMVLPRITAIDRVKPRFGNYYFDVETDRGPRRFLLSAPENNSMRPLPDMLVIRDVSGNCYEINPVSGLDKNSLRELDRVL